MPPRKGQGRGYGSSARGREYEEERESNFLREEGRSVEGRRQRYPPALQQEQQQHYPSMQQQGHRTGARIGGQSSLQQQEFVEERGDQTWRSTSRGGRASNEPTQAHSNQDWRSDSGFHDARTVRTVTSEPAASFEYGGRRGEDQGGGGGSVSYRSCRTQDHGGSAILHGGRRGEDQSSYGKRRAEDQGIRYSARREDYAGGGGTSSGGRRTEDHGGRRGEDPVYGGSRGVDQGGPAHGLKRVDDQGGGLHSDYGVRRITNQGEGGPRFGARGRRGGDGRHINFESGYGRGTYAEGQAGGNNPTTGTGCGGRGRRGGRLAAYPVPPEGFTFFSLFFNIFLMSLASPSLS